MDRVPCHAWCPRFFKLASVGLGEFISMDVQSENQEKMDEARILLSIPFLSETNRVINVSIKGRVFKVKIVEECHCWPSFHQLTDEDDEDGSDVTSPPGTPNSDTVKVTVHDLSDYSIDSDEVLKSVRNDGTSSFPEIDEEYEPFHTSFLDKERGSDNVEIDNHAEVGTTQEFNNVGDQIQTITEKQNDQLGVGFAGVEKCFDGPRDKVGQDNKGMEMNSNQEKDMSRGPVISEAHKSFTFDVNIHEMQPDFLIQSSGTGPENEPGQDAIIPQKVISPETQNNRGAIREKLKEKSAILSISEEERGNPKKQEKLSKRAIKKAELVRLGEFLSDMASDEERGEDIWRQGNVQHRDTREEERGAERKEAEITWEIGKTLGLMFEGNENQMVERIVTLKWGEDESRVGIKETVVGKNQ